jgi:hypothetical protein
MSTLAPAACQLGELSLSTLPRTIHPKRNPHLGNTETAANDETHKKGQRASVEPKEPILERLPRTARSLIGRDDTAYHRRARPQGRSSNTLAVRPSQSRDRENPPRPLARMALPVPVSSPDCMIRPRARACPHSWVARRSSRSSGPAGQERRAASSHAISGVISTQLIQQVSARSERQKPRFPPVGIGKVMAGSMGAQAAPIPFRRLPGSKRKPPGHRCGGFSCLDPH